MSVTFKEVEHIYSPNTPFSYHALKGVNLDIKDQGFTAIIGQTGSGKSTLIQHINALLLPTNGSINVEEYLITATQKPSKLKPLRKKAGLVFQFPEYQLFEETIEKDIMFGPLNFGVDENEAKRIASQVLNTVGLDDSYLSKSPFDLSGGQKRRVAIAGILAMDPDILILDEPTAGLDPQGTNEMMSLFKKINDMGKTIILVTHDSMIASYAKKFIYLRDGKIINEINRNNASQVDFFNEIVKITTQDSLLKLFNDTTDSKNVFSNNIDSSVTNSGVVIENEVANKVSETSNNEGMEVNVINKETKPVRRIVYAIFAGLEYDESSSKRYRILHFEEDTIDFQFSNIEKLHVTYPEVEKAIISMCSRYVPSFPVPENRFYLDLDLVLKDGKTYKFEVNNQRNATSLFDVLHQHNIKVEDPCGFEELYRSKGDYLVRHRWLLYNFRKIDKQYHLDNPRGASKSFY